VRISVDGGFYLAAGEGKLVPSPYSRRWLLPAILADEPIVWATVTYASLAVGTLACAALLASYGANLQQAVLGALLWLLLPGVQKIHRHFPVLVDAHAMAAAMIAAVFAREGNIVMAVVTALWAGAVSEKAPVFAALWAWNPIPLIGLATVGWFRASAPVPREGFDYLKNPVRYALKQRRKMGLNMAYYALPWGPMLLGLMNAGVQVYATLAVAYAQLLFANDGSRLYQWAAPPLVYATVTFAPPEATALLILWSLTQVNHLS
jgi:hypothetical protein